MCTSAWAEIDGEEHEVETVGDLRSLGIEFSMIAVDTRDFAQISDLECLCSVDFSSIQGARRATEEYGFPFPEWVIER